MIATPRHDAYAEYSEVYDKLKGDRGKTIALLHELTHTFHSGEIQSVLEFACGTGSILEGFSGYPEVVGSDLSANMLTIARKKLPGCTFIEGDMTTVSLGQQFNIIFCVHNSVNHLSGFENWKRFFANVHKHLLPGGIFIFDVNSPERLDAIRGLGVSQVGQDYVITKVSRLDTEVYEWDVRVLRQQQAGSFEQTIETLPISAYPIDKISAALNSDFVVKEVRTQPNVGDFNEDGRTYFICQKR